MNSRVRNPHANSRPRPVLRYTAPSRLRRRISNGAFIHFKSPARPDSRRRGRLDLCAVARRVLSRGLAQRRELEYASRHLSTLEINSTYYGAQRPESFTRWHDETPEDFVFSLKAPRFAMNRRVLAEAGATIERFLSGGVLNLRDKLGPINWQLTPGKRFDPEDYARFLELLPDEAEGRPLRHALEVRDKSFCTPEFVALARKHKAAIVVSGDSGYPLIGDSSAPFVYARIMGTAQDHPQGYAPADLDLWAARARLVARRNTRRSRHLRATARREGWPGRVSLRHQRLQGTQPCGSDGADRTRRRELAAHRQSHPRHIDRASRRSRARRARRNSP